MMNSSKIWKLVGGGKVKTFDVKWAEPSRAQHPEIKSQWMKSQSSVGNWTRNCETGIRGSVISEMRNERRQKLL